MSLFALTASSEQKRIGIDYLNKLFEEKVRDQDEYTSLLRESSKLVAAQKQPPHRTPNGSFCFVADNNYSKRRLSANTPTLAQSTNHLLAKEETLNRLRRRQEEEEREPTTLSSLVAFLFVELNLLAVLLVRAGFVSKRVVVKLRQNFKIYLFIFVLFAVIAAACFFSLIKLFNKINNKT